MRHRTQRDHFDLWLLFQQEDIDFDVLPGLVRSKLKTVNHPDEPRKLWENPDVLKRVWADDLSQLMRDVPSFDIMFQELRTLFEQRMPETL